MKFLLYMYKTPLYLAAEKGINDIFQSLISHPTIVVEECELVHVTDKHPSLIIVTLAIHPNYFLPFFYP